MFSDDHNHSITIINNYLQGCIHRLETNNYEINELFPILKKIFDQTQILTDTLKEKTLSLGKTIYFFEKTDLNAVIRQTILLFSHEMLKYLISIQFDLVENAEFTVKHPSEMDGYFMVGG